MLTTLLRKGLNLVKLDIKQLEGYAFGAVQPSITIRFHGDTGEEENLKSCCVLVFSERDCFHYTSLLLIRGPQGK